MQIETSKKREKYEERQNTKSARIPVECNLFSILMIHTYVRLPEASGVCLKYVSKVNPKI